VRLGRPWSAESSPMGDSNGRAYDSFRWSRFKNFAPATCTTSSATALPVPSNPGRRRLHIRAPHEGRAFHDPNAGAVGEVVDLLGDCRWRTGTPRATSTNTCSGRSPPPPERPVPDAPTHHPPHGGDDGASANDIICDPACGTAGFLVAAGEHLRERHPACSTIPSNAPISMTACSTASDFDNTMLRIGSMNCFCMGSRTRISATATRWRRTTRRTRRPIRWSSPIRLSPGSLDYENTAKDCSRSSRPGRPNSSSWRSSCVS